MKSCHSNYIPMQIKKKEENNHNGCGVDSDDNNQVAGIYERAQFNADPDLLNSDYGLAVMGG